MNITPRTGYQASGKEAGQIYNTAMDRIKRKGGKLISEVRVDVDGDGDKELVRRYQNKDGSNTKMTIDANSPEGYSINMRTIGEPSFIASGVNRGEHFLKFSTGKNQLDLQVNMTQSRGGSYSIVNGKKILAAEIPTNQQYSNTSGLNNYSQPSFDQAPDSAVYDLNKGNLSRQFSSK